MPLGILSPGSSTLHSNSQLSSKLFRLEMKLHMLWLHRQRIWNTIYGPLALYSISAFIPVFCRASGVAAQRGAEDCGGLAVVLERYGPRGTGIGDAADCDGTDWQIGRNPIELFTWIDMPASFTSALNHAWTLGMGPLEAVASTPNFERLIMVLRLSAITAGA